MTAAPAISDLFKARGARRLVYCHCDHFEPWRSKPRTIGPENAALVEEFAKVTSEIEEARRLTLFYRPHCRPVVLPREGSAAIDGDELGFLPLDTDQLAITRPAIRALVERGHELQLHIHHERVTRNQRYSAEAPWAKAFTRRDSAKRDSQRLRLLIQLSLATIRAESGLPFDKWLFVHGNWALAASDPDVCMVEDELELLHSLGCLGDFTFAGQPLHDESNPEFAVPSLVRLARGAKAFDSTDADALPALGVRRIPEDRFFIWSSPRWRIACALDYRNPKVELRTKDPLAWAAELAGRALKLGDTLYLLTYGHSMSSQHGELESMLFPHAHPGIRRMFGHLFESASAAGLAVDFLTASEVMESVLHGRGEVTTDAVAANA